MIAQVQLKDFVTDFLIEGQRELTLDVAMQAEKWYCLCLHENNCNAASLITCDLSCNP